MKCKDCWLNDNKRLGVDYCMLPRCPYEKNDKRGGEDGKKEKPGKR
nr:hypothetical protein [uncultured Caproiciproducens sp.]